jgi:hypothetical protein
MCARRTASGQRNVDSDRGMLPPTPRSLRLWWQPLPLFVVTAILVVIVYWFGLALVEVHPGQPIPVLRTGGWFYLGSPFVVGLAVACAFMTTFVARRVSQLWIWLAILPLSVYLAYAGGTRDFPERRLPVILGTNPATTTDLEYRVVDSFNDGDMTVGALEVSPEEFAAIIKNRDLTPQRDMSRPMLAEDKYPDGLPTASNDQLSVWYDATGHQMYFRYHSRRNRGGRHD